LDIESRLFRAPKRDMIGVITAKAEAFTDSNES